MRLIDADKLKIRNVSADYWYTVMGVTDDDIDNAPTVKAIPIEWIEKYIWSADTHEEKETLRKMYISWEKENERV